MPVRDLHNLPLHQLIGGPLLAIVEAEAQAAQATVEFIERVGFDPPPPTPPAGGRTPPPAPGSASLGPLRMAEFEYSKEDENGVVRPFRARVPVLALTPIPAVRVKYAKVSFTARITDAESEPAPRQSSGSLLSRTLLRLRGGIAPAKPATQATRGSMEIDIAVELESAPFTPGLEKVLHALDLAIRDEKKP